MTHYFIQLSPKTGPISSDAQRKGEFKISDTWNQNHIYTATILNFSGKAKHKLQVTSSNPRVTSSNQRVKSPNLRVTFSNVRVASLNLQVTRSNPQFTSSNPRVRKLKAQVLKLKAQLGRLNPGVGRSKARVEIIKPRIRTRTKSSLSLIRLQILDFLLF